LFLALTFYKVTPGVARAVRRRRRAAAADFLLTPPPPIVTDQLLCGLISV